MSEKYDWISNPYAIGAIGCYVRGKKIGGISEINGIYRANLLGEEIYREDIEETENLPCEAMSNAQQSVESAFSQLPSGVKCAITNNNNR